MDISRSPNDIDVIDDSPQTLLILVVGAFVTGWLVAKVSAWIGARFTTVDRDPRDDRIRSLEAELRIARSDKNKADEARDAKDREIGELNSRIDAQDAQLKMRQDEVERLRADLRESVQKTHELREELSDRAEENLRSTVKLAQIETELSVARASSDLMSTGVLDYSVDDDDEDAAKAVKSGS